MIRHLIVFNLREGLGHQDCLDMIDEGRRVLTLIPGVTDYHFGEAVDLAAKYRYYLAIDFTDESVIELYKYHPLHVKFADEWFRRSATDRITTDYNLYP
ncbi:Dabb family protein [Paenibacillus lignilyticus]|uniref:Dabb family protein n=1 Tax=Paenibacillus lignilyticus TaxID=1172615 RepID=A0ABS5CB49_9BACL|nr:Dabb family protein [Paenibacillus lignilyticus]MBP3962675.1 Dabb family protein [Paenibacillus lignilyticus]